MSTNKKRSTNKSIHLWPNMSCKVVRFCTLFIEGGVNSKSKIKWMEQK